MLAGDLLTLLPHRNNLDMPPKYKGKNTTGRKLEASIYHKTGKLRAGVMEPELEMDV
jgi:hypothetical protein